MLNYILPNLVFLLIALVNNIPSMFETPVLNLGEAEVVQRSRVIITDRNDLCSKSQIKPSRNFPNVDNLSSVSRGSAFWVASKQKHGTFCEG